MTNPTPEPLLLSRRTYLVMRAIRGGVPLPLAQEAVSTTALAHPEWDLDERRTWSEWWAVDAGSA